MPLLMGNHRPASETSFNGVSMVGRRWPNIECWLGSFVSFQGIRTFFAKKPFIFVIFQGARGVDPLPPPLPPLLDPPMLTCCMMCIIFMIVVICRFSSNYYWRKIISGTPSYNLSSLCIMGKFSGFLASADFSSKLSYTKNSFRNTISVKQFGSRSGGTFFGPDLGPNCLQMLSAGDSAR